MSGKGDKDRRSNKGRFGNNWMKKCLLCLKKIYKDELCKKHYGIKESVKK
jgi:hypothetical protein